MIICASGILCSSLTVFLIKLKHSSRVLNLTLSFKNDSNEAAVVEINDWAVPVVLPAVFAGERAGQLSRYQRRGCRRSGAFDFLQISVSGFLYLSDEGKGLVSQWRFGGSRSGAGRDVSMDDFPVGKAKRQIQEALVLSCTAWVCSTHSLGGELYIDSFRSIKLPHDYAVSVGIFIDSCHCTGGPVCGKYSPVGDSCSRYGSHIQLCGDGQYWLSEFTSKIRKDLCLLCASLGSH